jgi:nickel transport protein
MGRCLAVEPRSCLRSTGTRTGSSARAADLSPKGTTVNSPGRRPWGKAWPTETKPQRGDTSNGRSFGAQMTGPALPQGLTPLAIDCRRFAARVRLATVVRNRITPNLLCVVVLLAIFPGSVSAHTLYVFAHAEGKVIQGKAYFRGQVPAQDVTVTALDPAGQEIGKTTTDQQGAFSLEARFRCNHRLLADTGDGHGGEFTITAAELPEDLPARGEALQSPPATTTNVATNTAAGGESTAETGAVASAEHAHQQILAELARLREQLSQYEQRVRLQDVLGAIGYILGVTGLASYYLASRRKRRPAAEQHG